jgi:integrase
MATIRERSGKLIADFRYMGIRCRETTNLEYSKTHDRTGYTE